MSLLDLPRPAARPLQDRVILVSGACGGLGCEAALASARAGATVILQGRKLPQLNRLYDVVAKAGPEPVLYPLDLEGASPDDYATMAESIAGELGRLDGVLHCAAEFRGLTPLEHTDPAAFARAVHVNLTAGWWLSQACLPLLKQAPDAALVFVLDDTERTRQPYWGGYGLAVPARSALVSMLAAELAGTTVRVSGLQPGPMRTGLRSRAYAEDRDPTLHPANAYADACVTLLSEAGAEHRGQVWKPQA